jgi:fatty-acyl-CoA synthase
MPTPLDKIGNRLHVTRTLLGAGIVKPGRPDRLARAGLALHRFGPTPAAGYVAAAARYPNELAIIDELGTLTFEDVNRRSNALAHSLADLGISEGDGVGIMCRNHRGFIDVTVACSKLGAHSLYLNTGFAAPQITDVVKREKPVAIVYDEEFHGLVEDAAKYRKRIIAWHDPDAELSDPTVDELIAAGDPSDVVARPAPGAR